MKIAVPTVEGKLSMHFGHCQEFVLVDVEDGEIKSSQSLVPPPHAPGVLPKWLHEQGADLIIASGMGMRAQNLFRENGIDVLVGAPVLEPEELVKKYVSEELELGDNICDH
ncbi:ATPase [Candidatus Poribacteria bacterium]|nr:ATPase [Candidatus Poribacteria bacterium]